MVIPPYKEKDDAKEYTNYRSLKMLEHAMKVVERVFEDRIRNAVEISKIQIGLIPGKDTTDAIIAVRQQIKKY